MTNRDKTIQHLASLQLEQIKKLCPRYRVARLYLFGSILTDQYRSDSDLDLLEYADNYFDFLNELRKVTDRDVDLVIEKDLSNPVLIEEINAHKMLIYEQEDSEVVA